MDNIKATGYLPERVVIPPRIVITSCSVTDGWPDTVEVSN